ncbi:helix-turn-helix transcriptional regulator [Patescibacteria group bacterium]|nr:helix-turn-helix transcriptional regulator [Patescibacteria group bacterium]
MKTIYTTEYKDLIERLREARLAKGLTQIEVSERLKKGQSFISKVEGGQRRLDIVELKTLANVYGVDVSELIR